MRLILCHLLHLLLFPPILKAVFFTLLIVSFVVQKLLSLIRSHLFIFAFISNILGGGVIEDPAVIYVGECFACFPLGVL